MVATGELRLFSGYEETFADLLEAIEGAQRTCFLEFYIWQPGGLTQDVEDALGRAADRGVDCRVLVDALGSKVFLKSPNLGRLRSQGVEVEIALPLSALKSRWDLRNHRKIVVIDSERAYTGSQNLVDPRFFKQDAGVGEWVDAMVRVDGRAARCLEELFLQDWMIETGTAPDSESRGLHHGRSAPPGSSLVQVLPSGPSEYPESIHQVILGAIYAATDEIILTTPYFVPDDSILNALRAAALRGVGVTIALPEKNDSLLVRYASASNFEPLLMSGVMIKQYGGGLLHTKSLTVDGRLSIFGSVNLDIRSLWLNAEISLLVYDRQFTSELRALQQTYLSESKPLEMVEWQKRGRRQRTAEGLFRLAAPVL